MKPFLKKWLPVAMAFSAVLSLTAGIVILFAVIRNATETYQSVCGTVCAVLLFILTGLIVLYLFLSTETAPNFFLFDRRTRRNTTVEELTFAKVNERLDFLVFQISPDPAGFWSRDILTHEDETFGYRSVYKPLVAYKLLYDMGSHEPSSDYWDYLRNAVPVAVDALVEALNRVEETKLTRTFCELLENCPEQEGKMQEFLFRNLGYFRSKIMRYVTKYIEMFY